MKKLRPKDRSFFISYPMRFLIPIFSLLLICSFLNAQDIEWNRSTAFSSPKVYSSDLRLPAEDWHVSIGNSYTYPAPGLSAEKDAFLLQKQTANQQLQQWLERPNPASGKTESGPLCTLGMNWSANPYDGGVPTDNGIAVSDSGYVVSVANSTIRCFNSVSGSPSTPVLSRSLNSFAGLTSAFTFDPKVTYDPVHKRFIVVFLKGASSSNSFVYVAFSKYQDPALGWNIYAVNASFGGICWTDFPQIGISTEELFISGNKFTNSGSSLGAAVWQITLADGYAGLGSITTVLHNGPTAGNYFSLHPVQGGSSLYGPHFYLISNSSSGVSNQFTIHRVSNTIAAGGTLQSAVTLTGSPGYAVSPDAVQTGTSMRLATNDCRIQDSFLENGKIEFVFNTANGSAPAIYWGTIKLSPLALSFSACTGRIINLSASGYHLAFPGISYSGEYGSTMDQNGVFIATNFCGPSKFPGLGALYCDTLGSLSDLLEIRTSGNINTGGSSPHRWGDYAQSSEKPGSPGEAWVIGTYGSPSTGAPITYLAQVFKPGTTDISSDKNLPQQLNIFPNPAADIVHLQFTVPSTGNYTIDIMNSSGCIVHQFGEGFLKQGECAFQFSTQYLPSGIYFVRIFQPDGNIQTEKLVVQ